MIRTFGFNDELELYGRPYFVVESVKSFFVVNGVKIVARSYSVVQNLIK
jgi:hypothetical protein